MNLWLLGFICWTMFGHGCALSQHGKTVTYKYGNALIGSAATFFLLYKAGLFTLLLL